jgi:hypothetical protein
VRGESVFHGDLCATTMCRNGRECGRRVSGLGGDPILVMVPLHDPVGVPYSRGIAASEFSVDSTAV